jgi:hypothetical protein
MVSVRVYVRRYCPLFRANVQPSDVLASFEPTEHFIPDSRKSGHSLSERLSEKFRRQGRRVSTVWRNRCAATVGRPAESTTPL